MKQRSYLASAAPLAATSLALAAPASAAPGPVTGNTGVLACNGSGSGDQTSAAKHQLAAELQLKTKLSPTIDEWNGCFKVSYTDNSGHTVVGLYDPDSLSLVNKLS